MGHMGMKSQMTMKSGYHSLSNELLRQSLLQNSGRGRNDTTWGR